MTDYTHFLHLFFQLIRDVEVISLIYAGEYKLYQDIIANLLSLITSK